VDPNRAPRHGVARRVSVQATFSATLVDEWVRLGVTDAVVCAGSRSTPLALPLADRLRVHVRLDERSGAFFALGLAMASGKPTVICVTSGTAAVELHPAVVEAHHAGVPLIVCTADRPPELHDTGAPQSIDQDGLFAAAVRWSSSPGVPAEGQEATWRPLAVRAFEEAVHGPNGPGPVHLNLAFREPLIGTTEPLPARQGPRVVVSNSGPGAAPIELKPLRGRGMLIAGGPWSQRTDPAGVAGLADTLGWPVLADPLSGSRTEGAIGAADAIVRTEPPLPECIVVLGTPWLSRALATFVAHASDSGARIIVVDPCRQWADPLRVATEFHQCEVDRWLDAALATAAPSDPQWIDSWREREAKAQKAIAEVLGTDLSEPLVARVVHRHAARSGATLVAAASMPIRDLEWYAEPGPTPPRVLANRGVNGIDGVVSTALGIAASGSGEGMRTLALMGDLTFLHDVSGLVNLPDVPCTFVVLDNGGGGIFSFLPQATSVDPLRFEQLFGTPPSSDIGAVAHGFGLPVREISELSQLESALAAPTAAHPQLLRVKVPGRPENVVLHDTINQAVRLALQ
jgi:2-succinyl-5-enolpyruvyl-6-hydroxy-3-cyclohexene-1-carboxylate synthase